MHPKKKGGSQVNPYLLRRPSPQPRLQQERSSSFTEVGGPAPPPTPAILAERIAKRPDPIRTDPTPLSLSLLALGRFLFVVVIICLWGGGGGVDEGGRGAEGL